jgi:hypothetical protein
MQIPSFLIAPLPLLYVCLLIMSMGRACVPETAGNSGRSAGMKKIEHLGQRKRFWRLRNKL